MFVTVALTCQLLRSWLNDCAFLNIEVKSVTFEVSQLSRGWLKDFAPLNIADIVVTFEVFHVPSG